jgi:arylsulfatase A-like enzyme/Tfp pilus assembly protein PilF
MCIDSEYAFQMAPRITRRLLLSVLALAIVGASVWLWRGSAANPFRHGALNGANVLLITIDTLRADALGAYGNTTVATPVLDRLAAGGVRFSNAHAQNVITLSSHANILSGRYPFRHGVRENAGFRFPRSMDTLATLLKARGYHTGAFVSAFPLDMRFGLDRGFDVYDDRYGKSSEHTAFRVPERSGRETVANALQWMRQTAAPSFTWVHVYEPHFPYTPPEPFASRYAQAPYYGEVSAVDAALAPLLNPILDAGPEGRTLTIVTGDHGESLGEHGETTHGLFAYEGTLRVPLIVYAPRVLRPRVVDTPVRHVDILPTVLDALGVAVPEGVDGRSLMTMDDKEQDSGTNYFESLSASLNRGWAPLRGVSHGSLKYIELPIPELYDLASDPGETRNLAASRKADVRTLQNILERFRSDDQGATRGRESAETRERLRSLGYVTSAAPAKTRYTEADDPKRLLAIDRAIDEVVSLYQRGDLAGAIALGRDVVRQRPDMPLSLVHLAFLYNEAGDHAEASAAIRRALELNPTAQDVAALAGAYLTEAGLAEEAVTRLAPYVSEPEPDVDVLIAYGVALASTGRGQEALGVFERAQRADPSNAMPLINRGTVFLMRGDHTRAAQAFNDALRIDARAARAYNGLGVIAAERRAYDEAISNWTRAVDLDPHDYQTLYNLGSLLIRTGRPAEARTYWERYVREAPAGLEAADVERVRKWLADGARAHR